MLKAFLSKQFVKFLLVGGFAAAVNFCVGHELSGTLPFYGDILAGYLAGMLTAFVLFEWHVFGENSKSRKKSVWIFVLVNAVGLLQTWLIYPLLKDVFFPSVSFFVYPELIARAIAIITPTITSFVGHKFFTFKQ